MVATGDCTEDGVKHLARGCASGGPRGGCPSGRKCHVRQDDIRRGFVQEVSSCIVLLVIDDEAQDYDGPWQVAGGTPGNRRFGTLLKRLRERSGLTPQHLADHAGVHVSFVRGIERGAQAPSVATARPLLACVQEHDRIQWIDAGRYDLVVRDPETERHVAFEFKAKVKGQHGRTEVDIAGIGAALSAVAEVAHAMPDAGPAARAALSALAERLQGMPRLELGPAAKATLLALAEAMPRIVPATAATGEPPADVVTPSGDGLGRRSGPADEAAFGRVVRLLAAANEQMLERVERLLVDGRGSDRVGST